MFRKIVPSLSTVLLAIAPAVAETSAMRTWIAPQLSAEDVRV